MFPTRFALAAAFAVAPAVAGGARLAAADEPPVGTVRTLSVLSVSLAVDSTGSEKKRAVYAPPPGWYVRSHRVVTASRHGTVAYTVSTVPAGWDWRAAQQTSAGLKVSGSATVSAYKVNGGGSASAVRDQAATDTQANASSHHLLVVDVTAKGAGLWMGGSGIELTVVAEMVYVGK